MSNTTNNKSDPMLFRILNLHKQGLARDVDRANLGRAITKTEERLFGEDLHNLYFVKPECDTRKERLERAKDVAIDNTLINHIFPVIACTQQYWRSNTEFYGKNTINLYWAFWHVVSEHARNILRANTRGIKHLSDIKSIWIDCLENSRGKKVTSNKIVKMVKADLKNIKQLPLPNDTEMELGDYIRWAGCAYWLILRDELPPREFKPNKCPFTLPGNPPPSLINLFSTLQQSYDIKEVFDEEFNKEKEQEGDNVYQEGDNVYIEGRKRRK